MYNLQANSAEPDKTPRSVPSDLDLHCLSMFHKKNARLLKKGSQYLLTIYTYDVLKMPYK